MQGRVKGKSLSLRRLVHLTPGVEQIVRLRKSQTMVICFGPFTIKERCSNIADTTKDHGRRCCEVNYLPCAPRIAKQDTKNLR